METLEESVFSNCKALNGFEVTSTDGSSNIEHPSKGPKLHGITRIPDARERFMGCDAQRSTRMSLQLEFLKTPTDNLSESSFFQRRLRDRIRDSTPEFGGAVEEIQFEALMKNDLDRLMVPPTRSVGFRNANLNNGLHSTHLRLSLRVSLRRRVFNILMASS
jgi:hypothetical protein